MGEKSHIDELSRLSRSNASGEFIVASNDTEVHLYLQRGRIAWGTTSTNRFSFVRHLLETCDIDEASFREVVDSCRKNNQPLGETLVSWGLATFDQVRGALKSQLIESLRDLGGLEAAQTVFLHRGSYAEYNAELTFSFDELSVSTGAADASSSTQPPVAQSGPDERSKELADRLAAALPEALWVEVHTPSVGAYRVPSPSGRQSSLSPLLAPRTLVVGYTDFVAIRAGGGTVLGSALPDTDRSVWFGLGNDSTIGNVLALLGNVTGLQLSRRTAKPCCGGPWRSCGDAPDLPRLLEFVTRAQGLVRALVLSPDRGSDWGVVREDQPADIDTARHWNELLDLEPISASLSTGWRHEPDSLGLSYRSMAVGHAATWNYASDVPDGSGRRVWMSLDREQSQGLGWALLTSLVRQIASTRTA